MAKHTFGPSGPSNNGKGDTPRPVNQKKYEEGYIRAFGMCVNKQCEMRYSCYRFLKTPPFHPLKYEFPGGPDCTYYVHCPDTTAFERMEDEPM